jgi:hypothetical protein
MFADQWIYNYEQYNNNSEQTSKDELNKNQAPLLKLSTACMIALMSYFSASFRFLLCNLREAYPLLKERFYDFSDFSALFIVLITRACPAFSLSDNVYFL